MRSFPLSKDIVEEAKRKEDLQSAGRASIREVVCLVDRIESMTGLSFLRMEMGIPGLPANPIGIEAEIDALRSGVASIYPRIQGIPALKEATAKFIKAFSGIDLHPACCVPTTGSASASFLSFMTAGRRQAERDTVLFLDPGFPVHKQQVRALGLNFQNLDIYEYRGQRLESALEPILAEGSVSSLLYSNPNNPAWICLSERELEILARLCNRYDVIPLEDLAYFAMDFRRNPPAAKERPHQPSIGEFTDHYILLISSSKLFSFAGERVGMLGVSSPLFERRFPDLKRYFGSDQFGHALIFGAAYVVSSGVSHSSQFALAAMLEAVTEGRYPLLDDVRRYGERAKSMKEIFLSNGFRLVYDEDDGAPLGHGFYFTLAYGQLSGEELIEELLCYGISAISLANTGSQRREGIRACVSLIHEDQFPELKRRVKLFHEAHALVANPKS